MKENTIIIVPVSEIYIKKCLDAIKKHTPDNYYIYLVDQTKDGIRNPDVYKDIDVYIRDYSHPNLGFSGANNLAIRLVKTKYFTLVNDDVEFLDKRWWDGVMYAFEKVEKETPDRPAVIVNPSSVRLPDWSVAKNGKDGKPVARKLGEHHDIQEYGKWDYDKLLKESHQIHRDFSIEPETVLDGVCLYCSVAHTDRFRDVGLLDEKYYPGRGEDYDYACRAGMRGYRTVGTTLAWVWHWWDGRQIGNADYSPFWREEWNNNNEKWEKDGFTFDIYGVKCRKCKEVLRTVDNITAKCPKGHDTYKMPQIKLF